MFWVAVDAAAQAATVESVPGGARDVGRVIYTAAAGEANHVQVRPAPLTRVLITDTGAVITPAEGSCERVDDHTVSCPAGNLEVVAGDGDDVIDADLGRDYTAHVAGGDGDDRLVSGPSDDQLLGGAGRDVLSGGAGNDLLRGDEGDPFADELDGGPGQDVLDYSDHGEGVVVDLVVTDTTGARAEGDRVRGFEDVTGGRGNDRLSGNDGANVLDGGLGADVLRGRAGDDELIAESSAGGSGDRVDAGAGADRVTAQAGAATVRCGTGRDSVEPTSETTIASDCERWSMFVFADKRNVLIRPFPRMDGRALIFGAPCPRRAPGSRCRGRLVLRDPASGELIASASYRARSRGPDATVPVAVSLSQALVGRARRTGRLRLRVALVLAVTDRDGFTDRGAGAYTCALRARDLEP